MSAERVAQIRARIADADAYVHDTYPRPDWNAPRKEHDAARAAAYDKWAAFHEHAADDMEYLLDVIAGMQRNDNRNDA